MGSTVNWIWGATGGLVGSAGLALVMWALFWDRSRGQRRCAKCWYDMSGTPGRVCSECGYRAKREKKLFKIRRHWRWAVIGSLIIAMGYGVAVMRRIRRSGWTGAVPTTLLVVGGPRLYHSEGALWGELWNRFRESEMWGWQESLLARRFAAKLDDQSSAFTPVQAAECLSYLGPSASFAVPQLLLVAQGDDYKVRAAAAEALGRLLSDENLCVPILIDLLEDKDSDVRLTATWALWKFVRQSDIDAEAAIPALSRALRDEDELLRFQSAQALSHIAPDPQVAIPVLSEFRQDDSYHKRFRSLFALSEIADRSEAAVVALADALDDPAQSIRSLAFEALTEHDDDGNLSIPSSSIPTLIELLQSDYAIARGWATNALGAMGLRGRRAIPALTDLLRHDSEEVREAAQQALDAIQRSG